MNTGGEFRIDGVVHQYLPEIRRCYKYTLTMGKWPAASSASELLSKQSMVQKQCRNNNLHVMTLQPFMYSYIIYHKMQFYISTINACYIS